MSEVRGQCPDWPRLAARREVSSDRETAAWREALEHRKACPRCRRAALEADPLLVLSGLPSVEVSDDEISDMQARVAQARRSAAPERGRVWGRWSGAPVWLRTAAAAAALAVVVGLVQLGFLTGPPPGSAPVVLAAAAPEHGGGTYRGTQPERVSLPELPEGIALLPLVESLDLQQARVYQMREGDLDLVMIVDGSLDI